MAVIEEIFFLPPMAVARLGGSDTPLASFTWVEDPSTHGAGNTVIQPAISLEVQPDGSVRPVLPTTIQFRDGALLRPVAPFFELWARVKGQTDPVHLTTDLLEASGGSADGVTFTVTVANRKAARRVNDDSCAFGTQIQVLGNDHASHPLKASGLGANPLVSPERPIPMGQFRVIRPAEGNPLGVDLTQLRVRFTPAEGTVYGPPSATSAVDSETNHRHEIVPPANRILNENSPWIGYDASARFNNPEPADTYDGADEGRQHSFGVVDDTCDGLIEAVAILGGARFKASARVFVAPPDFAPDRRPFMSLADDLIDRDPPVVEPQEDLADALTRMADLFQRAFETVSLANVDAMRNRSVAGGQPGGHPTDLPRTNSNSMTPKDPLFNQTGLGPIPAAMPALRLPFAERAQDAHAPLADADDLALFLRDNAVLIKKIIRPPYGKFRELGANPAAGATPNSAHRDPRITRDRLHDMRMPPYMLDADATALSLTWRQYGLLMDVVKKLQLKRGVAASAQPLPTATNAHVARVLARRKKRKS